MCVCVRAQSAKTIVFQLRYGSDFILLNLHFFRGFVNVTNGTDGRAGYPTHTSAYTVDDDWNGHDTH